MPPRSWSRSRLPGPSHRSRSPRAPPRPGHGRLPLRRPGVGALAGALATGWATHIRRQGLAVIVAVMVGGAAIVASGLTSVLPLALLFLAIAGWADVLSAVLRNTIIQLSTPDRLRGRLAAVQTGVVQGGPRLGDLEAGAVGNAFGNEVSVISGGPACIAGAAILAWRMSGFRRVEVNAATAQEAERAGAFSP